MRLVREAGKPIAQVARDLGINEGTLGNWVNADKRRRGSDGVLSEDERAELARLREENAELAMERVLPLTELTDARIGCRYGSTDCDRRASSALSESWSSLRVTA